MPATKGRKKGATAPKIYAQRESKHTYKCACCGQEYSLQRGNFPVTQSNWFNGNGHYLPFCKTCIQKMFEFYCTKYPDENDALKRVCMITDMYYNDEIAAAQNKTGPNNPRTSSYISKTNMKQYSGRTYDNYIDETSKTVIENTDDIKSTGSKVTAKMVKFWGPGLPEEDYLFLDDDYKDWTSRHECKTKAQETCFKYICMAELTLQKANKSGDPKKIKDAADTLQSLMTTANVKPNQTNANALDESNTFGTLIEKWENTRPVSDPLPEWKDVDGMGHYFRVWVLSPVLDLFKLKNPYREEYEEEIAKHAAHKPEFNDDDEGSDAIRSRVFGSEDGGSNGDS